MNPSNIENPESSSLETPSTVVEHTPSPTTQPDTSSSDSSPTLNDQVIPGQRVTENEQPTREVRKNPRNFFPRLLQKFNIYFILFIFVIIVACLIAYFAIKSGQSSTQSSSISTTQLNSKTLAKLQSNSVNVGDVKQTLNVEANANFAGSVLVRSNLDVAGQIKVGGPLSLSSLNASGTSKFDQLQANSESVSGNINLQGKLNVNNTINVTGGGTFGGPITAPSLTVNTISFSKDLQLNRHIDAGGGTPHVSAGSAVGNGGTVTGSGADTAGTVTVGIGGSPTQGLLASITFAVPFNITPIVVITPVGSGAASLHYYISRTTTGFKIYTESVPTAGTTFSFDYIVIE